MAKKILGYLRIIIGLVGLSSFLIPPIKEIIPETLTETNIVIASSVLILMGIFLIKGKKKEKEVIFSEVPIYQGKSIVGYRRQ